MTPKLPVRKRVTGHREGSAAVTASLATVDFPVSTEELRQKVGDKPVEVAEGKVVPLREMLDLVPDRTFPSIGSALDEIDGRWADFRAAVGEQTLTPPKDVESTAGGRTTARE